MAFWNGSALQTEFSETLGDTSTAFKARVLKWMNDIQDDICVRTDWPFLHKKGKKLLSVAAAEIQNLNIAAPGAPTLSSVTGGALTSGSSYQVRITFYASSNGYETEGGTASSSASVSGTTLQISVTAIPVSTETLVTSRRVYLSKDSGSFYYYSEIADNTTTTLSITADTTSTVEPPETQSIKKLLGSPWIETSGMKLEHREEDYLRTLFPQRFSTGTPQYFDAIDYNKILVWPAPSTSFLLSFNYIKIPARIFASTSSSPDLPIFMKNVLEAGVLWKGYQYRERDLAVTYMQRYDSLLEQAITNSRGARTGVTSVSDVMGDADGNVY